MKGWDIVFTNEGRYLSANGKGFLLSFGCNSSSNYDFLMGVVPKQKDIYSLDLLGNPREVFPCTNRVSLFNYRTQV
jgi:hypothetical protein